MKNSNGHMKITPLYGIYEMGLARSDWSEGTTFMKLFSDEACHELRTKEIAGFRYPRSLSVIVTPSLGDNGHPDLNQTH
jgi:hypothetical protein